MSHVTDGKQFFSKFS